MPLSGELATVDELGRLPLPLLSQAAAGIGPGDWVEFLVGPDRLALRKVKPPLARGADGPAAVHDAGAGGSQGRDGT
jgi:bifunctional DNA-binding transcriptional regulator/antitoxin component of YhaV-PrlF toxin-antitoxin module